MIGKIDVGDTLKCLDCKQTFELENIRFNENGEYIVCPLCNSVHDVQEYHLMGELVPAAACKKNKGKGMEKLNGSVLSYVENILAHSELKQNLVALKEFAATCAEAGFSKETIDDITRYIAVVIYATRFNVDFSGGKK